MGIPTYACNPSLQEAEAGRSFWAMYTVRQWGKGKGQDLLFLCLSFMDVLRVSQEVQLLWYILSSYCL